MINSLKKVYKWQKIFGRNGNVVSDTLVVIPLSVADARASFLEEEIQEYLDANKKGDIVGVIDALCDIQYFLFGMVVIHGAMSIFTKCFNVVHWSNMSKIGENKEVLFREDGKILKGPNYWKPTNILTKIVDKFQQGA